MIKIRNKQKGFVCTLEVHSCQFLVFRQLYGSIRCLRHFNLKNQVPLSLVLHSSGLHVRFVRLVAMFAYLKSFMNFSELYTRQRTDIEDLRVEQAISKIQKRPSYNLFNLYLGTNNI